MGYGLSRNMELYDMCWELIILYLTIVCDGDWTTRNIVPYGWSS